MRIAPGPEHKELSLRRTAARGEQNSPVTEGETMTSALSADDGAMASARTALQGLAQNQLGKLTTIQQQMSVLEQEWTGRAGSNFAQAVGLWQKDFNAIINLVSDVAQGVTNVSQIQTDAEGSANNVVSGLPNFV